MQNPTELTVSTGSVPESSFVSRIHDIENAIARRAYEFFASRGFTDGHDLNDWFSAESELLEPAPLHLSQTDNELTLKGELPGFTEKDIHVRVEPRSVSITGQHEENVETKKNDEVVSSERRSRQVLRVIDLPDEVDPDKAKVTFAQGSLEILLPRKVPEKAAIQAKAA